jgi:hypothetical protein
MFDGSELSAVYGDSYLGGDMLPPPAIQQNNQNNQSAPTHVVQAQVAPDVQYNVPEQVYTQQNMSQTSPQSTKKQEVYSQESFWDRMGYKKGDVFKLFMFALVIVLAISMDKLLFHYMKNYIDENMMNSTNEFLLRLSYPVMIVIVIWILKSL